MHDSTSCSSTDQILRRLAPSLTRHVGCTIVEINPTSSTWSSKIHQLLKPKVHIFTSPYDILSKPSLQALVDAPDSRYKVFPRKDFDLLNPDKYVESGFLPEFGGLEKTSSQENGLNDSLLILANVGTSHAYMNGKKATDISQRYALSHFANLLRLSDFHRNGRVRMLMWMGNDEKSPFVPRSIYARRKAAIWGELTCRVEEVAGSSGDSQPKRREPKIDYDSYLRTAKRMENEGIELPLDRLDILPRQMLEAKAKGHDANNNLESSELPSDHTLWHGRDWHTELQALQEDFANGVFSRSPKKGKGSSVQGATTPQHKRLKYLGRVERRQRKMADLMYELLDEQKVIDSIDVSIRQNSFKNDEERQEQVKKAKDISVRIEEFKERMNGTIETYRARFEGALDERRAFYRDQPILQWDKRTVEPIIVRKEEFLPEKPLALIDFQPLPPPEIPLTKTQLLCLRALLHTFYIAPSQLLTTGLNILAPGAADALIPKVPSINNVQFNLDDLRAQMLTPQMLIDLTIAFSKWPFRPTLDEVIDSMPRFNHNWYKAEPKKLK